MSTELPPQTIQNLSQHDDTLAISVEELLRQLIDAFDYASSKEELALLKEKKDWLLGRQSFVDAAIAFQIAAMKQAEHDLKMQVQTSDPEKRNLDKDDMRIITQFLEAHAEADVAPEKQSAIHDARKRKPVTERNTAPGL